MQLLNASSACPEGAGSPAPGEWAARADLVGTAWTAGESPDEVLGTGVRIPACMDSLGFVASSVYVAAVEGLHQQIHGGRRGPGGAVEVG
jgi:hypothetical protein